MNTFAPTPVRGQALGHFASAARALPGVTLCGAVAWLALRLGNHASMHAAGLSGLSLAIVFGIVLGNTVYRAIADHLGPGVVLCKQQLLRLGIVLYGLRLTLQDVAQIGAAGVAIDLVMVVSTFALALLLGRRWLGLDRETTMLIGAGSSICGAAAVLATQPVVRARAEQVAVAVATVVVFGTLATFVYPVLHGLNQTWPMLPGGDRGFGVYIGSTIHEVAQVVAAGDAVGPGTADAAVIAKMVRVMLLAPFLLTLSGWLARGPRTAADTPLLAQPQARPRIAIPWFAVGFVAVVVLNSLPWLPTAAVAQANALDNLLLAMAMVALGLTTHVGAVRKAGLRPLLLALMLAFWLVVAGALVNRTVFNWLG